MRFLLLACLLLACSSDPEPEPAKVCAPGQQIECACPGSTTKGAQVCKSDGSGFDACLPCAIGGGGAGGGSGGGAGTSGSDPWPGHECKRGGGSESYCVANFGQAKPLDYYCKTVPDVCAALGGPGAVCCPR